MANKNNKKGLGILVFFSLSLVMWGVALYLFSRADESALLHTYSRAAIFVAIILSSHTLLYTLFANRKSIDADWYRAHGQRIEADITHIKRRGHRAAWRIKARYIHPKTGQESTFKSDILRANPSSLHHVGGKITVYIHPQRPRQYWMDVGIESEYL